jgi:hypothetical protein
MKTTLQRLSNGVTYDAFVHGRTVNCRTLPDALLLMIAEHISLVPVDKDAMPIPIEAAIAVADRYELPGLVATLKRIQHDSLQQQPLIE